MVVNTAKASLPKAAGYSCAVLDNKREFNLIDMVSSFLASLAVNSSGPIYFTSTDMANKSKTKFGSQTYKQQKIFTLTFPSLVHFYMIIPLPQVQHIGEEQTFNINYC